jgi:glutamyl endopeptidase
MTTVKTQPARNGHSPASNRPAVGDQVRKTASQPPSSGAQGASVLGVHATHYSSFLEAQEKKRRSKAGSTKIWTPPTSTKLRDVAEASFGAPPPREEIVIGPDDRIQIADTSVYPWCAIASLLITAADNSTWIGTGWFIGPHTLATAGHCVCITNSGVPGRDGWVRSISVMPGRNGGSLPYGSVTSTAFFSTNGWIGSGDPNYDYGAIILPTDLGNTVGWFGFGAYTDDDLQATVGHISGYPGDQPEGTQWYDSRAIASVDQFNVYYEIDTFGGQSGSPVYREIDGGLYGFAIHNHGFTTQNGGRRITSDVFDNLVAWKA